jgi:hypothetical protein
MIKRILYILVLFISINIWAQEKQDTTYNSSIVKIQKDVSFGYAFKEFQR